MVYHRAQAQYDRARWNLLVLVPAWIVQLAVLLTLMGIFSYRLADTVQHYEEQEQQGIVPIVEIVWECTNAGLSLLSVILTFIEVAKLGSETLTPWTMLFNNVIKIVCAFAMLALDIVVYSQRTDGYYSVVGLILDCVFVVATLISGIYAIRTFRRLSVFDEYHYTVNAKPYGYGPDDTEYAGSRNSRLSIGALSEHLDRRLSSGSSIRRESAGIISPLSETASPIPLETVSRTPSYYSHKRDTQFEDYVAARQSLSLKSDIERAMAAEFGWTGSPGAGADGDLARRPSIVGAGAVHSGRVDATGRTPSSGSMSLRDGVSRPLTAVPEGMEEEADGRPRHETVTVPIGSRPAGADEDRQALLGHERSDGHEYSEEKNLGQRKRKWASHA